MNGYLEAILVFIKQALDLDEVILIENVNGIFDVIPHFGFDVPAAIAERQREIGLSRFLGLYLLGDDNEAGDDYFVFVLGAIADEEIFHDSLAVLFNHRGHRGSQGSTRD